jgi:integrase
MNLDARPGMSLYGSAGGRKYLNAAERQRFIESAQRAPPMVRLFCLVLRWSGGRISEALALTPAAIDIESGTASFETLKRRKRGFVRQVPLPRDLLSQLNQVFRLRFRQRDPELAGARLWTWSRHARHAEGITTWLWCERLSGQRASPLGATLARSRFAKDDLDLWRRNGARGTCIC